MAASARAETLPEQSALNVSTEASAVHDAAQKEALVDTRDNARDRLHEEAREDAREDARENANSDTHRDTPQAGDARRPASRSSTLHRGRGPRKTRKRRERPQSDDDQEDDEAEQNAARDLGSMTVGEIISTMRKRGCAAPSPSSIARRLERKRRRGVEAETGVVVNAGSTMGAVGAVAETRDDEEDENEAVVAPQMRIDEDGNIVVDQASLVVTASGGGANARRSARVTTVENVARGAHITAGSFMQREKGVKWEGSDTERFYAALGVFGTDFSLMMRVFPRRSRRQLKLKFKREERENPDLIDAAMRRRPASTASAADADDTANRAAAVEQLLRPVEGDGADLHDDNSSADDDLRSECASAQADNQSNES